MCGGEKRDDGVGWAREGFRAGFDGLRGCSEREGGGGRGGDGFFGVVVGSVAVEAARFESMTEVRELL